MTLKIIKEKENPLFGRKEIEAEITLEILPSHKESMVLLSKKYSVPEENIKIKGIYGKFGSKDFKVNANIYKSREDKENIERKTKKEIEAEKKEIEARKKAEEEAKKAVAEEKTE